MKFAFHALATCFPLLALTGCATLATVDKFPNPPGEFPYVRPTDIALANEKLPQKGGEAMYLWMDPVKDQVVGAPGVVVRLNEQRAYFYRGDFLAGITRISTGKSGHSTPPGNYTVGQKDKDHRSNLYGVIRNAAGEVVVDSADSREHRVPDGGEFDGAPMSNFLRLKDERNNLTAVGLHAGVVPRYRASHGCIRLPRPASEKFYEHAELGMPVRVVDEKDPFIPDPLRPENPLNHPVPPKGAPAATAPATATTTVLVKPNA